MKKNLEEVLTYLEAFPTLPDRPKIINEIQDEGFRKYMIEMSQENLVLKKNNDIEE